MNAGNHFKRWFQKIAIFLGWALTFGLAYSQAPLFSSNQNQYFLKGLAQAGWGHLNADWLQTTQDPTPVFSFFVEWIYRIFQTETIFYVIYALLMGVYLYSLAGIVDHFFPFKENVTKKWVFYTALVGLHSMLFRGALIVGLGHEWQYLFEGGWAGQRLLGDVLQPSSFGIFILLSIYLFLKGRTWEAVILLPFVATIHPTYLLSAGTLTAAYMWLIWRKENDLKQAVGVGAVALILVSGILMYSLKVFGVYDPALYAETRAMIVNFRIPHHAIIGEWFNIQTVIQIGFMLGGLWVVRKSPLFTILFFGYAVVFGGTGLQLILQNDSLALLFPWRLSVFLVPISVSLIGGWAFKAGWKTWPFGQQATMLICSVALVGVSAVGIWQFGEEYKDKFNSPEQPIMTYVAEHKKLGQVYIVPLDWQDFRLMTGARIVVEFKSIPYMEMNVDDWHVRVQRVGAFYRGGSIKSNCDELYHDLVGIFHASHVVLPKADEIPICPGMALIFDEGDYALYSLDRAAWDTQ